MPVVTTDIKAKIKALLEDQKSRTDNPAQALDDLAEGLAAIIAEAIKSADVKAGITVNVDPNTGVGSTTSTGSLI